MSRSAERLYNFLWIFSVEDGRPGGYDLFLTLLISDSEFGSTANRKFKIENPKFSKAIPAPLAHK